jgi:cold shock CspA family protein
VPDRHQEAGFLTAARRIAQHQIFTLEVAGRKTHQHGGPEGLKMQGVLKFFNQEKYYGFIINEAGGEDWFFHGQHVLCDVKDLQRGVLVSFWLSEDERNGRVRAVDVRIIDPAALTD